ncbi:hypothetical protein A2U01_0002449 [Trifolium medium]|uniref:Uncharacterized protein n=1 Tax=Trifolium medium TaxID=97028 RepID=A0A392M4I4_9FABA|nr:hypothetical protein [Trifolium medium]
MKRGTKKTYERRKKAEVGTSAPKQNSKQKKLKKEQVVILSSDSEKIDYDWAKYLAAYDPSKEDTDSEGEVTQKSVKTEESKTERPKTPESDHASN